MRRLKIPQKLVYEKFYVHEIAAEKLSKIFFLKNANQTTAIYIAIELQVYKNIIINLSPPKNMSKVYPVWDLTSSRFCNR